MAFYHVRIDYFDEKVKKVQTKYAFDQPSVEMIIDSSVIPFLKKETIIFSGSIFSGASVSQIKIYETNWKIQECVRIANDEIPRNVIFVYSKESILGVDDYTKEITDGVFQEARKSLSASPINIFNEGVNASDMKNSLPHVTSRTSAEQKPRKLFISHAGTDIKMIEEIVSFFEFLGFDETNMICSSVDGYRIPLGADIYDYLRQQYLESELFIIFIHSPSYYQSAACLNEMGAAWVMRTEHCSILLPGFDFSDMKGAVKPTNIAIKPGNADAKSRMNELRDKLYDFFRLDKKSQNTWERRRDKLLAALSDKTE